MARSRTEEQLQAAVDRGAVHLDVVRPDWWRHVSVVDLNMAGCDSCVLAQVYGSDWLEDLDTTVPSPYRWAQCHVLPDPTQQTSVYLGFDVARSGQMNSPNWREWESLERMWKAKIKERQDAAAPTEVVRPKRPLTDHPDYALLGGQ